MSLTAYPQHHDPLQASFGNQWVHHHTFGPSRLKAVKSLDIPAVPSYKQTEVELPDYFLPDPTPALPSQTQDDLALSMRDPASSLQKLFSDDTGVPTRRSPANTPAAFNGQFSFSGRFRNPSTPGTMQSPTTLSNGLVSGYDWDSTNSTGVGSSNTSTNATANTNFLSLRRESSVVGAQEGFNGNIAAESNMMRMASPEPVELAFQDEGLQPLQLTPAKSVDFSYWGPDSHMWGGSSGFNSNFGVFGHSAAVPMKIEGDPDLADESHHTDINEVPHDDEADLPPLSPVDFFDGDAGDAEPVGPLPTIPVVVKAEPIAPSAAETLSQPNRGTLRSHRTRKPRKVHDTYDTVKKEIVKREPGAAAAAPNAFLSLLDPNTVPFGSYTRAERWQKIQRYREKRAHRNNNKRIMYVCRKRFADTRPRVGGRFVKLGSSGVEPAAKRQKTAEVA